MVNLASLLRPSTNATTKQFLSPEIIDDQLPDRAICLQELESYSP
jgi:hypothetical protein